MLSIPLKPSAQKKTLRGELSEIITLLWRRLAGAVMSLNDSDRVASIADNRLLKVAAMASGAILAPITVAALLWTAHTLVDVGDRLGRIETTVNLKLGDVYPRPEAVAQFSQVGARMDGLTATVDSNTHRIGALEAARLRSGR